MAAGLLPWQQRLPNGSLSAPKIPRFAAPYIKLIWHWFRKGNLKGVLQKALLTKEQEPKSIHEVAYHWHLKDRHPAWVTCLDALPSQWAIHPLSHVFWEGMITLWACQAFSREPGCLIFREAELRRLELNSGYRSYHFIYKLKMQLLGLLWGPSLSNTNTKNPTKLSKHQQNS